MGWGSQLWLGSRQPSPCAHPRVPKAQQGRSVSSRADTGWREPLEIQHIPTLRQKRLTWLGRPRRALVEERGHKPLCLSRLCERQGSLGTSRELWPALASLVWDMLTAPSRQREAEGWAWSSPGRHGEQWLLPAAAVGEGVEKTEQSSGVCTGTGQATTDTVPQSVGERSHGEGG